VKISSTFMKSMTTVAGLMLAAALHAQTTAYLPDAPEPNVPSMAEQQSEPAQSAPVNPSGQPEAGKEGSVDHALYQNRKWAQYVDPGEHVPRLSDRDKIHFWLHQEGRISSAIPALISAGYGQLVDSPKYGSDAGAFADRLGGAFLRQATMRLFCSSIIPALDGEDPRYFRKASGDYLGRAGWAVEQSLITRRDSGRRSFNFSDVFGHLAASALTPLYYPAPSRNARVVLQTWGTSIAGAAGNNLFLEFWPDVVNKLHRLRH
jgi:hypothetical protein